MDLVSLDPVLAAIQIRRLRDNEPAPQLGRLGHSMLNAALRERGEVIVHVQDVHLHLDDLKVLERLDGHVELDGAFVGARTDRLTVNLRW